MESVWSHICCWCTERDVEWDRKTEREKERRYRWPFRHRYSPRICSVFPAPSNVNIHLTQSRWERTLFLRKICVEISSANKTAPIEHKPISSGDLAWRNFLKIFGIREHRCFKMPWYGWYRSYRANYASAVLGVVILSVRLSVRSSHACFVTNRKNLPAIFLYHMKRQSF